MPDITGRYPREYDRPPVYDRVPSPEAIERFMGTPSRTRPEDSVFDHSADYRERTES